MAIIYSYPQIEGISGSDLLLICDSSKANRTFSSDVTQLSNYVIDQAFNGTDTYIPVFDGVNSLINSALKQDSADTPTSVTVASDVTLAVTSNTTVGGTLSVTGASTFTGDMTAGNINASTLDTTSDATVGRNLDVTGRVDASQVRIEGEDRPLVITKTNSNQTHITLLSTVEGTDPAFIASTGSFLGIGGVNGYSSSNLNIKKTDGFVGILQKNPVAPLHVRKSGGGEAIRVENGNIGFYNEGVKHSYIGKESSIANNLVLEAIGSGNKIVFKAGGSERVRITEEGKVGIGATSIGEDQILKVQGRSRNVVVTGNGNLGVGVDVPEVPLHCSGTIRSNERIIADKFLVDGLNPAPNTPTSPGQIGEIRFTADYIYVCINNNAWKRVAISTWT